jgi:hypothetical protein
MCADPECMCFDGEVYEELDVLEKERNRLRAAIESAPHDHSCLFGAFTFAGNPFLCDCWKCEALAEPKP